MQSVIVSEYVIELYRFCIRKKLTNTEKIFRRHILDGELSDNNQWIAAERFFNLLNDIKKIVRDEGFFFEFGRTLDITKHGFFGYLARSCKDVYEVLKYDALYFSSRMNFLLVTLKQKREEAVVVVEPVTDIGSLWKELRDIILGCLSIITEDLTGNNSIFSAVKIVEIKDKITFTLGPSVLNTRVLTYDERLKILCEKQCETISREVAANDTISGLIKRRIITGERLNIKEKDIAREIGLSTRTIRRLLHKNKTTFREILNEVRKNESIRLLKTTNKGIKEIAYLLGYSSTPSFISAFRKWEGVSPKIFREKSTKQKSK